MTKKRFWSFYGIHCPDNGNDAIDMAREQHPDLILLDLIMPGMNGSTTAKILENDTATKEIPLIFLTGLITKREEEGRHTRGGKRFIAKPCNPKDLLEAVDKCLEV